MSLRSRLDGLGLVGERRAVAVLVFAFYAVIYFLVALADSSGWARAFAGLSSCYALAVFGLVAGWFWARWYASGIAWSGVMMGAFALVLGGWHVVLAVFLVSHAVAVVLLMGRRMAEAFDLRPEWQERFGLDEPAVLRVRRAVTRAAAALPSLVVWALAPRAEAGAWVVMAAGVLGLWGLIRMRTAGVLLCGAGAIGAAVVWGAGSGCGACSGPLLELAGASLRPAVWVGLLAAVVLGAACAPFAGPIFRFLRRPTR